MRPRASLHPGRALLPRAGCWGGDGAGLLLVFVICDARHLLRQSWNLGAEMREPGEEEREQGREGWGLAGGEARLGVSIKDGEGGTFSGVDGRLSLEAGGVCEHGCLTISAAHRNVCVLVT